jgi:hypothetical protein
MNDELRDLFPNAGPTEFDLDMSVLTAGGSSFDIKDIDWAPPISSQAPEGDSTDEQRAYSFALENQAHEGQQHQSPPSCSPLETKKHRDDTTVQMSSTNVAGASNSFLFRSSS